MAFHDPYDEQSGRSQPHSQHNDDFNPYSVPHAHGHTSDPSYDGYAGYRDDPHYDYNGNSPTHLNEQENVGGFVPQKQTARTLRSYRYDNHSGLWTKGGRGHATGRICCCTLMIVVLLFVTILLALVLWIRPPRIVVGGVDTIQENGSSIQLVQNGISVNLGVNITVDNPNYFSVHFKRIEAQIFYPINNNNTEIGTGVANNVVFQSHSSTNWTFPFTLNYTTTLDPSHAILLDLAHKCGVVGDKSNLSVNYKITLGLRILLLTISPVVKNSLTFPCPIDPSDIEKLIKGVGLTLGGS